MKNMLSVLALVALSVGCTKVPPGWVGVKVDNYGEQRGVQDFPIQVGRVWFNPFTQDVYQFPTFVQSVVWTKDVTEGSPGDDSITFNDISGASINADVALSYAFESDKVPSLFVEFRQDAENITTVYMRSQVRDAFSRHAGQMDVTDLFGRRKQELLEAVKADLAARLGPKGFRFDSISIVGSLRVDQNVQNSINAVIQATQRAIEAQNKVAQSTAEAQQAIAVAEGEAQAMTIRAKAQADSNKIVAASITPTLVEWQAVEKWNGILPTVTGESVPMINMQQK